jgi:pimeloyl-ACP methyl ester carboxylesterase
MPPRALHTVLVPPLACSARVFDTLMPYVWAHGAATIADTRRDGSVAEMAARLLDDAPESFVLVGISMGGYIALEVVRQGPARVRALALISTSAEPDTPKQASSRRRQLGLARAGRYDDIVTAAFPALVDPSHRDDAELAAFWSLTAHEVGADQESLPKPRSRRSQVL